GHDVVVGSCSYWDVSNAAIAEFLSDEVHPDVERDPSDSGQQSRDTSFPVPGHAGQFETSMMLAVAPNLVRLDRLPEEGDRATPIDASIMCVGSVVQAHGDWQRSGGFTDVPIGPNPELGQAVMNIIGKSVA